MARTDHIPFDIVRLIIIRLVSPSVVSLDDWADSINVLAVSRMWRTIGEPMPYANIVISLETFHTDFLTFHSNLELVVSNSFENHVRATIVHIAPEISRHEAMAAFFWHMSNNLTTILKRPGAMRRFWNMVYSPTLLTSGACIEPLLLTMPNLRYLFVESRFLTVPWMESMSIFLHYSIARQSTAHNDTSAYNELAEFDFIASYTHENIPALNMQTSMTRMTLVLNNSEQTLSTSRRLFVPSNDRVQFCAEYIRRLRILDLPQSALDFGVSVDVLRNRNPCPPEKNYMRRPWYNFRYRSFICIRNIWFENSDGVTRYELFAFNQNANPRLLQIATSIPAEVSDPAQLLDSSSDVFSSSSDSDDN